MYNNVHIIVPVNIRYSIMIYYSAVCTYRNNKNIIIYIIIVTGPPRMMLRDNNIFIHITPLPVGRLRGNKTIRSEQNKS